MTLLCNRKGYLVFIKSTGITDSTTGENMATRIKEKNWHNTVESTKKKSLER